MTLLTGTTARFKAMVLTAPPRSLNPLSNLPPGYAVDPPSGPGFLDREGDEFLNWTITG